MAEWIERFQQGSFRGVPFKTENHELSGGRRRVDHEFPQREVGRSEDLGKKTRVFSMELLVIGDDYFQQRDALIEAFEKEGPGELVHPYFGRLNVQVGGFSVSETKTEGRMARFSVEFAEAGETVFPNVAVDAVDETIANAELVQENSKSFFENTFSVLGAAQQVIENATADAEKLMDTIDSAVKSVTEPVANLTFAISNFKAATADLVRAPGEMATRIQGVFDDLLAEFEDDPQTAQRIMSNFIGSIGTAFVSSSANTSSATRSNENQTAIVNIANLQGLSTQSKAAVESEFLSSNSAVQVRDEIFNNLDEQLEVDGIDDELFQNIKDLQASISDALPPQNLGEIITFTPQQTEPVIVIAHRLFQNLEKENEIIDQNSIEHPGFVPGGTSVEVSSG